MIDIITRILLCIAGALLYVVGYLLIDCHDEDSGFWFKTGIGMSFIIGTVLMQVGV